MLSILQQNRMNVHKEWVTMRMLRNEYEFIVLYNKHNVLAEVGSL